MWKKNKKHSFNEFFLHFQTHCETHRKLESPLRFLNFFNVWPDEFSIFLLWPLFFLLINSAYDSDEKNFQNFMAHRYRIWSMFFEDGLACHKGQQHPFHTFRSNYHLVRIDWVMFRTPQKTNSCISSHMQNLFSSNWKKSYLKNVLHQKHFSYLPSLLSPFPPISFPHSLRHLTQIVFYMFLYSIFHFFY